jgi:hypothetical protein
MLGTTVLLCAACFPSLTGLSDGKDGGTIPVPEAGGGDDSEDAGEELGPVPDDSGVGFDVQGDTVALPYALSCADAKTRGAKFDGNITIDPDGLGPYKPFEVFCKDMDVDATTPKEYLTLVNTTDPSSANAKNGSNVSTFGMGSPSTFTCSCPPDDVRAYNRVRIDVSKSPIKIITSDIKFSATNHPGDQPSSCEVTAGGAKCNFFSHPMYNYGVGSSCVETPQTTTGRANVDLRGTPFHISMSEKGHLEGYQPFGSTMYVNDGSGLRKQAEVQGGGRCGMGFSGSQTDSLALEQD